MLTTYIETYSTGVSYIMDCNHPTFIQLDMWVRISNDPSFHFCSPQAGSLAWSVSTVTMGAICRERCPGLCRKWRAVIEG